MKASPDELLERFERLVRENAARVLATAQRVLGDADAAQDVSQEVFVAVWKAFERLDGGTNWPAYLRSAAVRRAVRELRRRKPENSAELDRLADSGTAADGASLGELQGALRRALARLPERQGCAFAMVKLDGLSYGECAKTMRCSEGAARVNVHTAMRKLAKMLKDHAPQRLNNMPPR